MTSVDWFVVLSSVLGSLRLLREADRPDRRGAQHHAEMMVAIVAAGLLAVLGLRTAGHGLMGGVAAALGLFVGLAPRRLLARLMPDALPLFSDEPDLDALPEPAADALPETDLDALPEPAAAALREPAADALLRSPSLTLPASGGAPGGAPAAPLPPPARSPAETERAAAE